MDLLPTVDIMDQQFTSIAQQEPEFLQAATPQAQHDVLEYLYGRFTARRTREHMRLFLHWGQSAGSAILGPGRPVREPA